MPIESLKADILARYKSVHAFCKARSELSRASVYLVLSGKYPGRMNAQIARIRAALAEPEEERPPQMPQPPVSAADLVDTLQEIRCTHCRRLDRRECMSCRDQTGREGSELFLRIFGTSEA